MHVHILMDNKCFVTTKGKANKHNGVYGNVESIR